MKNKLMDFPKLKITKDTVPTFIYDLYIALGWNGDDTLDPSEIKISNEQWHEVCSAMIQLRDELDYNPSYQWLNCGPAVSPDVPYGKVQVGTKAFNKWIDEKELSSEGVKPC